MANFLDLIKGEGEVVQFIRGLVEKPISAAEILSKLREGGLGIRTQTGYQIINYLRDVEQPSIGYLQGLGLNALPNPARLPQSITTQLRNYAYTVAIKGISSLTGEPVNSYITISTNDLITKQQAIDIATDIAESEAQSGGVDGAEASVERIQTNIAGINE